MATLSPCKNETLSDWKVAILCSAIYFFEAGAIRIGSLFYVEFIDRFNVNRQKASIPLAMSRILMYITGPVLGYCANHFQLRSIITFGSIISSVGIMLCFWAEDIIFITFSWGILFGIGASTGITLLLEVINRQFDKHLSTACGVYVAGASIGSTVLPYVTKVLLDYYGLSGTFLILGGLFLNLIPLSLSLPVYPKIKLSSTSDTRLEKEDHTENHHLKEQAPDGRSVLCTSPKDIKISTSVFTIQKATYTVNESHKNDNASKIQQNSFLSFFAIFLNPVFIALGTIQSFQAFNAMILNTMLIDYCMEKGTTVQEGVYVVMIVSITDLVGRLGLGWITDYGFIGTGNFLIGSFVLLGLSCLMYIWPKSFLICAINSVIYGTMYGIVSSYSPKLFKDYIAPKDRTMAVASRRIFVFPMAIATPFILGYFKDSLKSYDGLMYVLAIIYFVSAVLTFSLPYLVKREKKPLEETDHTEQGF